MWKPRGYEAPEWNNATDIMIDQARQIGNLKARIEKRKIRGGVMGKELSGGVMRLISESTGASPNRATTSDKPTDNNAVIGGGK